jgi:hypothetical protein
MGDDGLAVVVTVLWRGAMALGFASSLGGAW